MKPTQEKTMEWESEFDQHYYQGYIELEDWNMIKGYIRSLLASSQDSFRRKVEEEKYKLEEFYGGLEGMGMDEHGGTSYQKHYKQGFNRAVKHIKEELLRFFPNL